MKIGTILNKPVDPAEFRQAMAFCCNLANGARMMEYCDRYEIVERLAEEPKRKAALDYEPEPDPVEALAQRVEALEKRIAALETQKK